MEKRNGTINKWRKRIISWTKSLSYMQTNSSTNDKKLRDPCHFTGKYRGVAHDVCNLYYKVPKEILLLKKLAK